MTPIVKSEKIIAIVFRIWIQLSHPFPNAGLLNLRQQTLQSIWQGRSRLKLWPDGSEKAFEPSKWWAWRDLNRNRFKSFSDRLIL